MRVVILALGVGLCLAACAPSIPRRAPEPEVGAPAPSERDDGADAANDATAPRDAAADEAATAPPSRGAFFCSRSRDARCVDFCLRTAAACEDVRRADGESCRAAYKLPCEPAEAAWCVTWVDPESPQWEQSRCTALRATCEAFRSEAARRNRVFGKAPTAHVSACALTR